MSENLKWTTANDVEISQGYVKKIKEIFTSNTTFSLSKLKKRESVILIWGKDTESGLERNLLYSTDEVIKKEYYIEKNSWIETVINEVLVSNFEIKPEDIIYDKNSNRILVSKVESRTKEDWEAILSK